MHRQYLPKLPKAPGTGTAQKAGPAPPRDLSGVWNLANRGGELGSTLSPDPPPMTPWGQAKFKANKPGYGPHALAVGNDPLLRCDPPSIPRILFFPRPMEIIQIPGRTLVSYETNSTWREIWTDGRELPKDPDPWWYGHSIGKWEADDTFVVETVGFNDKTWLDFFGQPHSDAMHLTERYQRVDSDTMNLVITVDDPKAYTKPWVSNTKSFKLKPGWEIQETYCSVDEEDDFSKQVRLPAGKSIQKKQ